MIKEKKLPPNILEKIPQLIDTLQKCEDVIALFFFGSLATGKLRPLSDLDIALLLKDNISKGKLFNREIDLICLIGKELGTEEFDLIILNTAPLRFAHQILKNGKKIFVKDQRRLANFQEEVIKKYIDFKFYQEQFNQAFLSGLIHG
ncbi:MAG: type VII toxin-antitoxin system MntA family adenylyltransferase antitoxin [Thermodesulfobacteriota bacterium]